MKLLHGVVVVPGLVALLCGCGDELSLKLRDAMGIEAGTEVLAAGTRIGEVESLSVRGSHVELTIELDGDHHMVLREGACASTAHSLDLSPLSPGVSRRLELDLGSGPPLAEDAVLGTCDQSAEIEDTARTLGHALARGAEGLVDGLEAAAEGSE